MYNVCIKTVSITCFECVPDGLSAGLVKKKGRPSKKRRENNPLVETAEVVDVGDNMAGETRPAPTSPMPRPRTVKVTRAKKGESKFSHMII